MAVAVATTYCGPDNRTCLDTDEATRLKALAMAVILASSAVGVVLPMVASKRVRQLRPDSDVFFVFKMLAAGVILATGFVHILPEGVANLSSPCLDDAPWQEFPMAAAIAMAGAIFTLVVDFTATQCFERQKRSLWQDLESALADLEAAPEVPPPGAGGVAGQVAMVTATEATSGPGARTHAQGSACGHMHARSLTASGEERVAKARSIVISQVLELGVVTHSVIIGIGVGVSNSPCSIRPLIVVLVFHQMFEGFALGGCIAQAGFKAVSAWVMALFFSVTTPLGIAIGMGVQSSYDEKSQRALIIQGSFNCFSAGILICMALVDLIASDFLSARVRSSPRLQVWSYLALFAGVGIMAYMARFT